MILDNRRKKLLEFMESFGLILINGRTNSDYPGKYTHISKLGNSVIDHIWCNLETSDILLDFKV